MIGFGRRPWAGFAWSYLIGAVLFAAFAVFRGQDANWDLQNYHDYVAFALLHWRYPLDVAPGGPQTYLNALPYVLPYLLRHHLPPVAAAVALAMAQALVVPLAWLLSGAVVDGHGKTVLAIRALATVTAVTGAITLSEVGTSFADLLLASLGLAALFAMLSANAGDGRRADRLHLLAGVLSGAAAGLKLTNALVVIAILGVTLIPWKGWTRGVRASGLTMLGAAFGSALSGGWWAVYLWASLGSPTFPFLNTVFRSHSAALTDFSDARSLPTGIADALAYPFKIAAGLHPTAENPFRDWRFAVALPLCAAFALVKLPALNRRKLASSCDLNLLQTSVFLFVGFTAWLLSFAIQRYAITFEIAAGLLVTSLLAALLPRRLSLLGAVLMAATLLVSTRPADWWHRPWVDAYVPHPPPEVVGTQAAYLLLTVPTGYWVSALPRRSRANLLYSPLLVSGGQLARHFIDGSDHPAGETIWSIGLDLSIEPQVRAELAIHGLVLGPPCYHARGLWMPMVFCHTERAGSRPSAASDLLIGESVTFSTRGNGWIYEVSGWQPASPDDTWAEAPTAQLALKLEAAGQPLALAFEIAPLVGPSWPESEVDVSMPGVRDVIWTFRQGELSTLRTVCVPDASKLRDGVLTITFRSLKPHSPRHAGLAPVDLLLSFALRTMTLRYVRPGECGRPGSS